MVGLDLLRHDIADHPHDPDHGVSIVADRLRSKVQLMGGIRQKVWQKLPDRGLTLGVFKEGATACRCGNRCGPSGDQFPLGGALRKH